MRFWDSSALVPLIVEEPASEACRTLARDGAITVWTLTATELASALRRREREGSLDREGTAHAFARLDALSAEWWEIEALDPVKRRARRLLSVHALRAADALQLAAALIFSDELPQGVQFITRDIRLRDAARREGFDTPLV